jgi:uncharacterized SAM-binding protein YcdF (DUF218 family)
MNTRLAWGGRKQAPERRVRRGLGALCGVALLAAAATFAAGFLVFVDEVTGTRPPDDPQAEGIVALTGGAQRIDEAVALLGRGSAERLLISGVYRRTSAAALAEAHPQHARLFRCCIDIGREALDTHGNALEARDWARQRGYASLIVVTSAYHMPRSLAEIGRALPGVELIPYPVLHESLDLRDWPTNLATFRLLFGEYVKYLVARLR